LEEQDKFRVKLYPGWHSIKNHMKIKLHEQLVALAHVMQFEEQL